MGRDAHGFAAKGQRLEAAVSGGFGEGGMHGGILGWAGDSDIGFQSVAFEQSDGPGFGAVAREDAVHFC